MKKKSLNDIAKKLGVSKTLISFVLNGRGDEKGISSDTQKKVLQTAKDFNYKPNHFARGLRLGKTHTIGLVVADISNKFYAKIARQVEIIASKNNYNLIIGSSDENPEKELALINMLRDRQVDGLVISTTQKSSGIFSQMKKENYPFVLIDRKLAKTLTNFVGSDNYHGAYLATSHILNNGFKRIGLLKISPSHLSSIKERELGYKSALKDRGMRLNTRLNRSIDFDNIRETVRLALQEMLESPQPADAIFSLNNNITVACLEYFNEKEIRIPQDIALVSFDDIEVFKYSCPTITAVAQSVDEMGETSVRLLMDEISNPAQDKKQIILPVRLLERKSSGVLTNHIAKNELTNII